MISYDQDALDLMLDGFKVVYDAVKVTLGPKGRNVIIGKYDPRPTHDGVTVARAVVRLLNENKDKRAVSANLMVQAAEKNNLLADGTSTVIVLSYHVLQEAVKLIAAGHDPMQLAKDIQKLEHVILGKLNRQSEKVTNILDVASVSAGEKAMGKVIADVIEIIGKDGIVTVEENPINELTSEIVDGFSVPRGFISPKMINNSKKQEAVFKEPAILVVNDKINTISELLPIIEKLITAGKKELVLFSLELGADVVANLNINNQHGAFKTVAITLPDYFDYLLQDIAGITEATVVGNNSGELLSTCELDVIGTAKRVIAGSETTSIVGGAGNIEEYIETLDIKDKKHLEQRVANIRGKVAIIKVGGATEAEINERKDRVDDAVGSTKAALKGGIVSGGGTALLQISRQLPKTPAGMVLKKAIEQPFRLLLQNAALNPDEWIFKITAPNQGIDLLHPFGIIDMKETGIIDAVLITKGAVTNAISVATTAMTAGAVIIEDDDEV